MKKFLLLLLLPGLIGCQSATPAPAPTVAPAVSATKTPEWVLIEPADPSANQDAGDASVEVTGDPELVFDWTTDRCEDEHIPDIAARAFRDAEGMVQLWIGHYVNYRMIGPDLDSVVTDCTLLMRSDYDPDPSMFNDSEWLAAPYTEDGETIYAIMHNEYRGDTHDAVRPGQCPSSDRLTCLDTSVTMAISTDGGDSFQDILEPPNHMVATMPYTFNDEGVPSGLRQPSNIIKGEDGFYYVFTNISDYPENPGDFPPQWVCLMRTDDLSAPASWRYWDGEAFAGQFVNPYLEELGPDAPKCAPLDLPNLSGSINETITYNSVLDSYILIGFSFHPTTADPNWGFYYSLSSDLVHWTQRELLIVLPDTYRVEDVNTDLFYAYPSLIDPDSTSRNFETTDGDVYLYLTRFNVGLTLDRDLVRFPVEIKPPVYPVPVPWRFDTAGDTEGWTAVNQLTGFAALGGELVMQSTGEDPSLHSPDLLLPAEDYTRLGIRMKLSPGGSTQGQIFFITDVDSEWNEEKSIFFDIFPDGQYHDYVVDMSGVPGWEGVITQWRLDPGNLPEKEIAIDLISFIE